MGNLRLLEINGYTAIPLYSYFLEALTVNEFFKDKNNFLDCDMLLSAVDWYKKEHEPLVSEMFLKEVKLFNIDSPRKSLPMSLPLFGMPLLSFKTSLFLKEEKPKVAPASKFVATYFIQIQNDKKFQVTMRVIGSKGANMKRIVAEVVGNRKDKDLLKLRLRGKGSGFKEGEQNQEAIDDLQLCMSAKLEEDFNKGCELIEDLLKKIYREYDLYCKKIGKEEPHLKIWKVDN